MFSGWRSTAFVRFLFLSRKKSRKLPLGVVLFNLRVDGDMELQRVAAIRYPSNQTGVLVLDKQGLLTSHCMVNGTFSSFIAPLEYWNTLPLATQARTSIAGPASLFIGALRNAGYLPRGRH